MRMSLSQEGTHSSRELTYSGPMGGPWLPLLLRPVGKLSMLSVIVGKLSMLSEIVGTLSMLSEIVKVVDGRGGGGVAEDLKCCPEKFLVCRKKFSVCRKSTALVRPPPKKTNKKTWVPRRHCLLNNTVILRSRACTFTVGWSHCHIQNSL